MSAAGETTSFGVRTEGHLLPASFLSRVAAAAEGSGESLEGVTAGHYHLVGRETLTEAANRSWTRLQNAWKDYRRKLAVLPADDPATTATREKWLLPLFQELGYGRLQTSAADAFAAGGDSYPVSHGWGHVPIHLLGSRVALETRTAGVAGAARKSPHSLVQELLNRSPDHLWAFLSNGERLRILRDNRSLTRQAFVEFDLESMMEGEIFSDFFFLYLLCHQSRVEGETPEECWLEKWSQLAHELGTRALEDLRKGVRRAIETLGEGFLKHPANGNLRRRLEAGELGGQEYYRQLLRLVYRLIFLFAAEDRDLLLLPEAPEAAKELYREHYSTRRLRRLASRTRGGPHPDLWRAFRLVASKLADPAGCPELGLPALGSHLWEPEQTEDLNGCELSNRSLLGAVWELSTKEGEGRMRQPVDYKNMGPEELGSVYEALLELQPEMNLDARSFGLAVVAGHERKTTGSYYTPTSLINALLDSALDPVLDEAAASAEPERALLELKVCDPACGSGHFLIAAAHRIAKRLASIRTGEEEPAPDDLQHALRDVISRCIYGVDVNPMALELCKVNLWLEALEPGRPLAFLDHHLQCGNSLLGATPRLMQEGIPTEAFMTTLELDDHDTVLRYRGINRRERKDREEGQIALPLDPIDRLGDLGTELIAMADLDNDSLEDLHEKERRYREILDSTDYRFSRLWADAWCAAFVWRKTGEPGTPQPITDAVFRRMERQPHSVGPAMEAEIRRLAEKYQFFHWQIAFPEVFRVSGANGVPENEETGWSGGFDVVLGNPPWEKVKLQEKEWFSGRDDEIAEAPNKAARHKLIDELVDEDSKTYPERRFDPDLYRSWMEARRESEGWSHFLRNSGRYPLTGRGDINTYQVFAGLKVAILSANGQVGTILPSGIATDSTTQYFFQQIIASKSLVSLFHFENEENLFPNVHHSFRFCLLTISGAQRKSTEASFVSYARSISDLSKKDRLYRLTPEELARINPNTRTLPLFKKQRDALITKEVHQRVPIAIKDATEDQKEGDNPWQFDLITMFHMSNDSNLFRRSSELEKAGYSLQGVQYHKGSKTYLPLFEAKMIHHFDHRFGTYEGQSLSQSNQGKLPEPDEIHHRDPTFFNIPRYWIPKVNVEENLKTPEWDQNWFLAWRDICRSSDQRTLISSILPYAGVGDTLLLMLPGDIVGRHAISAMLSSFIVDFIARQKVGGTHIRYHTFKQLPLLPPQEFIRTGRYHQEETLWNWIQPRILELIYTAWDLEPFARDCGYEGPPFRWDDDRRFLLRCELDAAFFHLYDIERDDVDYVMETFPIVKRKDVKAHGDYRTKQVLLRIYDRMQEAIDTGEPYQTLLDPPPGDFRVTHPSDATSEMATLADGAWHRPRADTVAEQLAVLAAVLKTSLGPRPIRQVRLATLLATSPELLGPSLTPEEAAHWQRLIGPESEEATASDLQVRLQEDRAWGTVVKQLRGTGALIEDLDAQTWAPGEKLREIPTSGWPAGRVRVVMEILRRREAEDVVKTLPQTARAWIDAKAA